MMMDWNDEHDDDTVDGNLSAQYKGVLLFGCP